VAFPSYNGITRGQLRALYNTSLQFINTNFALTSTGQNSWNMGFVEGGNFGRVDGRGNHYGMLHWQDAARAVEPEVVTFGPGNNWARAFSRYLINNQAANGSWNWTFSAALGPNSDNSGGVWLRAVWAILVLSPDAIPPLAIGTSNLATAPEGTVIAFNGAASDPGTGNPVYTWDFDNGDTRPGQNVSYAFPDNGTYDVTLSSTSIGGTSVDTLPITITNVAPTANAGADFTVPEGSAQAFNVAFTDPGTGDTQTFAWAFGDTGSAATQATSHAYADNGVFTVTATVTDDDGGVGTDTVNGTVTNVAPTITSTAPTTATEGQAYSYALTFTDPGTADTHTCTAPVAPAGSALTGCTLDWTPNFAQAIGAAAPVRLCVTDDDGGQTCQNYTIAVNFVDSDGDGLPDSWEISNFGDITSQDQFGDPDADGMNNLQEFTNVTDPNVYDGPNTPTAAAPICGGEIASLQTTLVANNAVDPQGAALIYDFQLYSDVGLTILVAEDATIAQGSGATTSWAVPVNLLENTRYYWRVRAKDQFTYGPYSTPACDFFVNTVNEAPGVPRINTPSFGSQVNALRPDLTVDNATDPDEDVLTYTFEVYRDPALSNLVASQAGVAAGATTTTWTVSTDLMEDHTYYWRVRATDPDALSGDWSSTGQFFVTTMNAVPEPPALVSPQNGTTMANVRPELVILNADDSDLDPLVYDWELATDDTFATIIDSGADVQPQGAVNTAFALAADLTEDTTYCWRARSDDGQATSGYNTACFLVSETNGAPSVPTLNNPSDNMGATTVNPVYSWAPSTDPEDDPITYEVEVKDAAGTVVATVAGVSGTVTSMAGDLQNGGTYTWHARAVDRAGAMSAYSADNTFIVDAPIDDPEVVVNGGGCQTSGPGAGLGLVGLGLLGLLRRRRR
ncbi:MAG: PKD domain-containing protein, partial [Kofleriaceae bacterium]|nr:PKD domain-containing protein [Kofleriaceae bacterium]